MAQLAVGRLAPVRDLDDRADVLMRVARQPFAQADVEARAARALAVGQLELDRADSALRQVEAQLGMERNDPTPPPDDRVASVRQASANRDDAKASFDRASQLNGRGLVSQVDRDASETRFKVAEANYQAAIDNVRALRATLQDRRAAYELATKRVNDAVIKAPVAGAVTAVLVILGVLTALLGALLCFAQRHLKRMLAFATISHVGLFLIGIALLDAGALGTRPHG